MAIPYVGIPQPSLDQGSMLEMLSALKTNVEILCGLFGEDVPGRAAHVFLQRDEPKDNMSKGDLWLRPAVAEGEVWHLSVWDATAGQGRWRNIPLAP